MGGSASHENVGVPHFTRNTLGVFVRLDDGHLRVTIERTQQCWMDMRVRGKAERFVT